jgi:hypothetical protein
MVFVLRHATNYTVTLKNNYLRTLLHGKTDPLNLLRGAGNLDKIWFVCGQHLIQ